MNNFCVCYLMSKAERGTRAQEREEGKKEFLNTENCYVSYLVENILRTHTILKNGPPCAHF